MINYLILFKKIENYDDIPKLGILFLGTMVMNPKNHLDNHRRFVLISNNHPIPIITSNAT
jgi:hypothetical protein